VVHGREFVNATPAKELGRRRGAFALAEARARVLSLAPRLPMTGGMWAAAGPWMTLAKEGTCRGR